MKLGTRGEIKWKEKRKKKIREEENGNIWFD
jgi:hypothetical protein